MRGAYVGVKTFAENNYIKCQKSRVGLSSYDDLKKGNIQRVSGDFLSPTFKAKIIFEFTGVTFNTACFKLFPNDQHVVINIDEVNQRLIVEPCASHDSDALKFANFKDGKNKPGRCVAKFFCSMVYDLVKWNYTASLSAKKMES